MLVNGIRWSESVAMAMESKGFCDGAPRSFYTVPTVHWYDWAGAAVCIGSILLGMVFLRF